MTMYPCTMSPHTWLYGRCIIFFTKIQHPRTFWSSVPEHDQAKGSILTTHQKYYERLEAVRGRSATRRYLLTCISSVIGHRCGYGDMRRRTRKDRISFYVMMRPKDPYRYPDRQRRTPTASAVTISGACQCILGRHKPNLLTTPDILGLE